MPNNSNGLTLYKKIEEEGRARSSERENFPAGDDQWLGKVEKASDQIETYFKALGEKPWERLARFIGEAAHSGIVWAWRCQDNKQPRGICDLTQEEQFMEDVDERAKDAFGKRCTFLRGEISPYNLSSYLNDLTACFHRTLEKYEDTAANWHKEGKCIYKI